MSTNNYVLPLGAAPCNLQYDASAGSCATKCGGVTPIQETPIAKCGPCTGLSDLGSSSALSNNDTLGNPASSLDLCVAVVYGSSGTTMGPITRIAANSTPWNTATMTLSLDDGGVASVMVSDGRPSFKTLLSVTGGTSQPAGGKVPLSYTFEVNTGVLVLSFQILLGALMESPGFADVTFTG